MKQKVIVDGVEYAPIDAIMVLLTKDRPSLVDAKAGDLCLLSDNTYVQLTEGNIEKIKDNYSRWNRCLFYYQAHEIIKHIPLAPEGTAEWAWQMWQLGYRNIHMKTDGIDNKLINCSCDMNTFVQLYSKDTSCWQIYQEPEGDV